MVLVVNKVASAHQVLQIGVDTADDLQVQALLEQIGDVGDVDRFGRLEAHNFFLFWFWDLLPSVDEFGSRQLQRLDEFGGDDGQRDGQMDRLALEDELDMKDGAVVELGGGNVLQHLGNLFLGLHAGLDGRQLALQVGHSGNGGQEVVEGHMAAVTKVQHHAAGALGILRLDTDLQSLVLEDDAIRSH